MELLAERATIEILFSEKNEEIGLLAQPMFIQAYAWKISVIFRNIYDKFKFHDTCAYALSLLFILTYPHARRDIFICCERMTM